MCCCPHSLRMAAHSLRGLPHPPGEALCCRFPLSPLSNFNGSPPGQRVLLPQILWLSDVLCEHWTKLKAAERKWHKSKDSADLSTPLKSNIVITNLETADPFQ
ncbi:hypothetical protein R3I93_021311 [Phoxinus phoxinus]|uniref:Uncharacterized protein n=1 Tax=Phoxinus phoxinus TaxID=58324 RepID=A0AAN9C9K8_9TELE